MDEANFARIEDFILKRMDEQERKAFLREMAQDEALRSEVTLQTELINAIETESMKATLSLMHEQHFGGGIEKSSQRRVLILPRGWAIAASIAVLITAGWFLFRNARTAPERLYAQYYTPDPGLPTTLNLQSNRLFAEGMIDYKMGKTENAIAQWLPLLQNNPTNDTLHYYLGVAFLENGNPDQAIQELEQIRTPADAFYQRAQWYLALAHLQDENTKEVSRILRELVNLREAEEFRDRANRLLSDLE